MGDNVIHYSGHVKMMAAVQPFISGRSQDGEHAREVTVEEIEQLHVDAWRMGVKAIAIYRDNCKVGQPLATAKKEAAARPDGGEAAKAVQEAATKVVEKVIKVPVREKLPRNRRSSTFEFRVADCKGFVTVGEYDDGRPGEIFLRVSSGLDPRRHHGRLLDLGQLRPAVRRAAQLRQAFTNRASSPPGSPTTPTCASPRRSSTTSSGGWR